MRISRETMFMEMAELVPVLRSNYDVLLSLRFACGYAA